MSDDIPDESLETVEDLWDAGVGLAGVLPPGADTLRLLLQRLDNLIQWEWLGEDFTARRIFEKL